MKRARSPSPLPAAKRPQTELLPELWQIVINALTIFDQGSAALVCRAWKEMAERAVAHWLDHTWSLEDPDIMLTYPWRAAIYSVAWTLSLERGKRGGSIIVSRSRWVCRDNGRGWSPTVYDGPDWVIPAPRSYRSCYYCERVFRAPAGFRQDGMWYCSEVHALAPPPSASDESYGYE